MLQKRTISMGLIGFLTLFGAAQVLAADDSAERLAALKKKREALATLHLIGTSLARSAAGTRELRIETWEKNHGESHKLRREVTGKANPGTADESTTATTLVIKDGTNAWREVGTAEKKVVFRSTPKKRTEYHELESIAEKGIVKIREGESFINQPCVVVDVRHKANPDDVIASYWISEKYGVVLKSTVKSDDATVTEWAASDIQVDEEISDAKFSYKPSYDAQVIEEKMGGQTRGD